MRFLLFFLFLILFCLSVNAATVSHSASEVQPGSFATGDYYFDGRVGIGTTNPNRALELSNGGSGDVWFKIYEESAGGRAFLIGSDNSTHQDGLSIYDETAGTTRIRIDNNGNVGIGTTDPSSALDVQGDITYSGDIHGRVGGSQSQADAMQYAIAAAMCIRWGRDNGYHDNGEVALINKDDYVSGDCSETGCDDACPAAGYAAVVESYSLYTDNQYGDATNPEGYAIKMRNPCTTCCNPPLCCCRE